MFRLQKNQVTLDEANGAAKKHQQVAYELKDVVKNQKKKIQEYRDLNSKLYDDIYSLDDDIKEKEFFVQKVIKQRNDLQNEVKFVCEKLEVKNEDLIKMDFSLEKQNELSQDVIKGLMDENKRLKEEVKS